MPDVVGIASGTLVKLGDGVTPTEAFTTIGELLRMGDVSQDRPLVDATRLSSTVREYVAGLKEGAEIDLELRLKMDDPQQDDTTGLGSIYASGAQRNLQVKWPGQSKGLEFGVVVINQTFAGMAPGELMRRTFRVKITTPITIKVIA